MPLGAVLDPIDKLKAKFPCTQLAQLNEISKGSAGLSSYLFYRDCKAKLHIFDTGPLPSQYMRKVIADTLDEEGWDWRAVGREDRLFATIQRLPGQFKAALQSSGLSNL
jgi:hypothetical protein